MSARVLVVDDIPTNVKLLETKLSAEYFDVLTASNGPDALAICEQGLCDLVLLDAPDWRYLAYHLGGRVVDRVVLGGELR